MNQTGLITPEELRPICGRACRILDELDRILLGHHEVHRLLLIIACHRRRRHRCLLL